MTTLRIVIAAIGCPALLVWAATPPNGTVSEASAVTWTGPFKTATQSAVCNGPNDPACDNFLLTVVPPPPEFGPYAVEVALQPFGAGDWDLQVYDADNNVVGDSGEAPGVAELVTLVNPPAGTYTVAAAAFAPIVGPDADGDGALDSYTARAEIKPWTQTNPPGNEYFTYANHVPPDSLGRGAAEPSIGANWGSGRTMFQAGPETLRVIWDDCASPPDVQWEDVAFVTTTGPSLDPILFTDPITGRTIVSQLSANCSTAAFTDDDGDNWLPSQGCGLNSGVDHQSIGGGPYHAPIPPPPPPLYPHPVYYCAQELATALCARSDDGGLTFGPAIPLYNLTQCGGLHGEPNVAPNDGAVYVPNKSCTGRQAVIASEDNGLTWSIRRIPFTSSGEWDPDIGIGSDGTLYVGMTDGDGHPKVAVSTDRGLTWSEPVDVGIPFDIDNTAFPAVVAGDGDRAAFAFLGIDADQPGGGGDDPSWPGGDPETRPAWHMYVAHTYDRGASWTTINVTPGDPVQRGTIFAGGFTVDPPLTRNLLDFNRVAVDKFGRVLIGWADGCVGGCITGTVNSNTEIATISRQIGGRRLFAQYDVLDVPAAPGDVSAKTSAGPPPANIVTWSEPDDHASRITAYAVYRRTPTTQREVIATLGADDRRYTDSAIVAGQTYFYSVTATNDQGESLFCQEVVPGDGPPPVSPCFYPGVTVLTDAIGDADTMQPAHDVISLSITEPLSLGPGRIMFVLKMAGLASLPPDTTWPILMSAGGTDYAARMHTDAAGEVFFTVATGANSTNPLLNAGAPADPASNYNIDGTIQIVVPRSALGDATPGQDLTQFVVRIRVELGGVALTPDNMPDSTARTGSYRIAGSEGCPENEGECGDPLFAGLQTVSAPAEETCTLDLTWETASTDCPPPSYNVYRSTSSIFTPSLSNLMALGVDGLTYRDQAGLEFGTTYYYIVRAEDSQTGFDGPANHGREDNNLVRVSGVPGGPPTPAADFSDDMEPTSEPGWTIDTAANANPASPAWAVTADTFAQSPDNSFFSAAGLELKDDRLIAPPQNLSSSTHLTFWHRFSFEPGYDGGVLEVSTDGGNTWVDAVAGGGVFVQGGYNGTIDPGFSSPIAGREAWTGDSEFVDAMTVAEIDLGAFAGSGVLLRWRLALDPVGIGATPGAGWWVDDVALTGLVAPGPCDTQPCGDGIVDAGEECDAGGLNSDTQPDACRTNCTAPHCGDGVADTGEGCDDGPANSDSQPNACRTDCQPARCGDDVVDMGELCDFGQENSDSEPDACRTNCLPPRCGDGTVDSGEACDDGPANSDNAPDACRTYCQPAGCGDGVVDSGEECDSGNVSNSDGCSTECLLPAADLLADTSGTNKVRFVSFIVDPAGAGAETAMRVRLTSLHHPADAPPGAPNFSAMEGAYRYVNSFGGQTDCPDSPNFGTSYKCAQLGCEPEYRDWAGDLGGEALHVTGDAVVPDSMYAVANLPANCAAQEAQCETASSELAVATVRWGDVVGDANGPPDGLANVLDISATVDKVKDLAAAFVEPRVWLKDRQPEPHLAGINVIDVSFVVDAVKGFPYPAAFTIDECP